MKNYRKIPRSQVWRRLIREENVYVVILRSRMWKQGVYDLKTNWSIHEINSLLNEKEENVDFYIYVKDEKTA